MGIHYKILLFFTCTTIIGDNLLILGVNATFFSTNPKPRNIPAMARKAGATARTSSTIRRIDEISEPASSVVDISKKDAIELSTTVKSITNIKNSVENREENEEDYSDESSEEQECPNGKYWHIRGHRCVPSKCPGGNSNRDRDTGECLKTPEEFVVGDTKHVCSICIEYNVTPYGRCCLSAMKQPHLSLQKLRHGSNSGMHFGGIRSKLEAARSYRGRG